MTIQGLGNDIIEVERVAKAIARHGQRFLDRIFTPEEQSYCLKHRESARHFAGRFAAKEAIVKSLGTGISESVSWLDIQIKNNSHGKPEVIFSDKIKRGFGNPHILISISHSHDYATAIAIYSQNGKNNLMTKFLAYLGKFWA